MPARAAVYDLLSGDETIAELGVTGVYPTQSVDTPSDDRFLIIRNDAKQLSFGRRGPETCSIWAHDRSGDYGQIDKILERVKDLLEGAIHRAGSDGWILTTASWLGDGPDLYDPGYNTVTRWSDFKTVSRYSST